MMTGGVTGMLAVWSIVTVQPLLDKFHFFDSSAVFSGHLVPGFIGAIASAIAYSRVTTDLGFTDVQVRWGVGVAI